MSNPDTFGIQQPGTPEPNKHHHHAGGHHKQSARSRRRRYSIFTGVAVVLAVIISAAILRGRQPATTFTGSEADSAETLEDRRPQVKTVHPKQDPSVQLQVQQQAAVEAYYSADLRARVSGVVRRVYRDLNDRVFRGELLIDVDVPDLDRDLRQKQSMVLQRRQELRVAEAKLADAEAGVAVAEAEVLLRQAEVPQVEATRDFRKKRLDRFRILAKSEAITLDILEEQERDYDSAAAAVKAAYVAIERAKAEVSKAKAKIQAAQADIDLGRATIDVAIDDMEKTRAVLGYASVRAPFDGVILQRNIDPGSFVQNASTGQSETLITVARTDLVTVGAKFPDNIAPLISEGTAAFIDIDEVPGLTVAGLVTRYSPSIQKSDRTMRVEVDLFNGDARAYERLRREAMVCELTSLAAVAPLDAAILAASCRARTEGRWKGYNDPFPFRAGAVDSQGKSLALMPGMTGTMRLNLGHFANTHVVPSSAVFSKGGKLYVALVRDEVVLMIPVRVQVNDGRLAKVSLLFERRDNDGTHQWSRELNGEDEVVINRQLELTDGQPVRSKADAW